MAVQWLVAILDLSQKKISTRPSTLPFCKSIINVQVIQFICFLTSFVLSLFFILVILK